MTSLPPDPYKALGVSKDAQIAEIRTAYRKLVLKCHPDKVQDPALKAQKADEFQKVQQAYELLNSEKERQRYDDQVRLAELREAMRAKANSSAPRATATYKYASGNVNIRDAEPRPSTFKPDSPPTAKAHSYSRSWEESASRSFEERSPPKRESSYSDKTKRESEREKERRDRDKERRKKEKAEEARRAEKEAKRAEKKAAREKAEEKERRREREDKKSRSPYIETFEDDQPKRRSSRKHDKERDRSSHREEIPVDPMPPPPVPSMPHSTSYSEKEKIISEYAHSYIEAAKAKKRPEYRDIGVAPPAPTPPPVAGQSSPFQPPAPSDEPEVHRSGKSRRGSSGEKSTYKKTSREVLNDPDDVAPSPSARYAQKSATAATMASSPPRLNRQNSAPADNYAARPIPTMSRATTYSGAFPEDPRGRGRSRLHPQIEESESEGEYDRSKHSSSRRHRKKHRSPEPRSSEYVSTYKVSDGRTTLQNSFSRSLEPEHETYAYYSAHAPGIHVVETRPVPGRESSYSRSAGSYPKFPKVHTSKTYDVEDIAYSHYPATSYQDEYAYA